MNIYFHFLSILNAEMTQVVEILPGRTQGPGYPNNPLLCDSSSNRTHLNVLSADQNLLKCES